MLLTEMLVYVSVDMKSLEIYSSVTRSSSMVNRVNHCNGVGGWLGGWVLSIDKLLM